MSLDRFWSKVRKTDDCWEWTGTRAISGYGVAWRDGTRPYAHRLSWEIHNGPIPAGMYVLHHCDNPPCIRPDHLFLGNQRDNMRDMADKGRARGVIERGPANPNSKLTAEDVRAIRVGLATGQRQADLARRFCVRPQSIDAIATGKSWSWLDAA